jgi:hypothetical protein
MYATIELNRRCSCSFAKIGEKGTKVQPALQVDRKKCLHCFCKKHILVKRKERLILLINCQKKLKKMNKLSVSEALARIDSGEELEGYTIDFDRIKVEALDVMNLVKHGIKVPEEAIYYDDEATQYDEEFEGDWERIDYDPTKEPGMSAEIKITLRKELKNWIESKGIKLDDLVEDLLDNFYKTQKLIPKK